MGRIQKLPNEIANKIAAGEVIERPASVVKELVENSIDAEATSISVQLEDAGKQKIIVRDDGIGMDRSDMELCLLEHATSKLSTVDDLFYVDTMGFRGEALPSIASISHTRIVSCPRGSAEGLELECHGGKLGEIKPAASAPGSTIEIANLFYNTPVRRKFLRQNSTEVSRTLEVIQRIAIAYPEVGFSLSNDGKQILDLPPKQSRKDRILAFAGKKLKDALIEVNDFDEYASLTGFAGSVNEHRPNSKDLHLFVNRRFIRDRSLLHAITLAYREFIPHGRYPVAYLFLELDPSEVDVNVHPTKIEVRFTQANRLFSKLKAALNEAVLRSGQLPKIDLNDKRIEEVKAIGAMKSQERIHAAMSDFLSRANETAMRSTAEILEARPEGEFEADIGLERSGYDRPDEEGADGGGDSLNASTRSLLSDQERQRARNLAKPGRPDSMAIVPVEAESDAASSEAPSGPNTPLVEGLLEARQPGLLDRVRGLFQVGDMFIIVETDEGLILIDQHAYHERVLYWRLEHRLSSSPPEVQQLLVPEPLELSRRAAEMVEDHQGLFKEFGFLIEKFGAGGWACYGLPRYIKTSKVNEFVASTLESIASEGRSGDPAGLRKSMVDMMACKAAIKAGERLNMDEMEALLAEGAKVPHTFACPHGRPTTFLLTFEDLEKIFHRR